METFSLFPRPFAQFFSFFRYLPANTKRERKKISIFTKSALPLLQNRAKNIVATVSCKHFSRPAVPNEILRGKWDFYQRPKTRREIILARHLPRWGGVTSEGHRCRMADGNICFLPQSVRSVFLLVATSLRKPKGEEKKIYIHWEHIALPSKLSGTLSSLPLPYQVACLILGKSVKPICFIKETFLTGTESAMKTHNKGVIKR